MKNCPTEKVEGDRITLGEPEAEESRAQVPARVWTLPALLAAGASVLVSAGIYALFEWLESRGAGTGKS